MGFAPLADFSIKVDEHVPMPQKRTAGTATRRFPWIEMNIGDSFFVAVPQGKAARSAHAAGTRYGLKFATRAVTENNIRGTRVWRTA